MKFKYLIYKGDELIYDSEKEGSCFGCGEEGIFDSYEDAQDDANEWMSCWYQGGEILNLSNPGDYDAPEEGCLSCEIEEIDD